MSTLIDLRRRIRSVKNTQQITKAMKTVATAKFKKTQRTVIEHRPLWHAAPDLLSRIAGWAGTAAHPLFAVRDERRVQVIVITSDKGLCGAFNANLLSRALEFVVDKARTSQVGLVLIGKKAIHFFRKYAYPVERAFGEQTDRIDPAELSALARHLIRLYVYQETDGVYLAYNEFKSVLGPRLTVSRLLPVTPLAAAPTPPKPAPDWEPGIPELLETLVPRYIEDQVRHAYAESQAAEQAARMMAMDNASKNAETLFGDLLLVLNKIRQASITKELLEIMNSVEAMKK
jgi:F-type H+-transporting ATPase subunit gamma